MITKFKLASNILLNVAINNNLNDLKNKYIGDRAVRPYSSLFQVSSPDLALNKTVGLMGLI